MATLTPQQQQAIKAQTAQARADLAALDTAVDANSAAMVLTAAVAVGQAALRVVEVAFGAEGPGV